MPAPIATLALVTLGSGLALGGWSYKRARDAQKKDPKPELTKALAENNSANDQDEAAPAADAKSVPTKKAKTAPRRKAA